MALQLQTYSDLIKFAHFDFSEQPTNRKFHAVHGFNFKSKTEFDSWINLKRLPLGEKMLLEAIYFSGLSMNRIGEKIGVSRQFVHKKHLEIIAKLNGQNR